MKYIILALLLIPFVSFSQNKISKIENEISELFFKLKKTEIKKNKRYNLINKEDLNKKDTTSIKDTIINKDSIINIIAEKFYKSLDNEKSFTYPYKKLRYMGKITSEDQKLRIYSWNFLNSKKEVRNFCFIQHKDKNKINTYKLADNNHPVSYLDKQVLTPEKWYGAVYYQITPIKHKGKKYYTLIGWDANNKKTQKKIIDIIYFDQNQMYLGAPLFSINYKKYNRVALEYSARVVVNVKYFKNRKMIIFDHIGPTDYGRNGNYEFYGPDMTHDAFKQTQIGWVYQENIRMNLSREETRKKEDYMKFDKKRKKMQKEFDEFKRK